MSGAGGRGGSDPATDSTRRARERVAHWVSEVVVGLDLCPFAAAVVRPGRLQIDVVDVADEDAAIQAVLAAASHLLETPTEEVATTLVVLRGALDDSFEDFLDVVAEIEGALEAAGADEWLQLASFHPDYRFADTDPDDVGNYTNRAPYPIVHLLRVDEVAEAVARHPDVLSVPEVNVARLRELGEARIRALGGLDD